MAHLRSSTCLFPLHFKCMVIKAFIYLHSLLAVHLPVPPPKSRQLFHPRASVRFSHSPPLPVADDSSFPGMAKGRGPGLPQSSTSTGAGNWRSCPSRAGAGARSPAGPRTRLTRPVGVCRSSPQLHAAPCPQRPLEQRQTNTGRAVCIKQGLYSHAGLEQ